MRPCSAPPKHASNRPDRQRCDPVRPRPAYRGFFFPYASMHADLERLIQLQSLNDVIDRAQRAIADIPTRLAAIDARLAEATDALAAARHRQTESQTERRTIEKELAIVQARLSKYKDQLMSVKTNKEYQAMQHEIATAQAEVSTYEDKLLQRDRADELGATSSRRARRRDGAAGCREGRAAIDGDATRWARYRERTASARASRAGVARRHGALRIWPRPPGSAM